MNETNLCYMKDIPETRTEWLWEPYIPRGKITIVQGDPGEGKTTLLLQIAAAVSRGLNFPDCNALTAAPDYVLYQNAEDGYDDTVVPRLNTAGADGEMIFCLKEAIPDFRSPELAEAVLTKRPGLVILDPLQAFLGDDIDMHRANEIRPAMAYLAGLAKRSGAAVVLIGHMNKMQGTKAIYRGLGSIDLTAAARSVLLVSRDPAQPENRVILQIKNSLAEMAKPCAFTLTDGKFRWLGEYDVTSDQLLNSAPQPRQTAGGKAERLLKALFAEVPTDIPQQEILEQAEQDGINLTALKAVKKALKLRSVKNGTVWYWTNRMFDTAPL